ncbi:erythromycin esterase family protein [Halorientalis brevis]|uniref:Erythromycin esterase family protein n=1 Tax=Halorientalis brevis TaxID=1126241 RepID=A0ABD6C9C8_9EURY|nr:erythromycin esterase family protein [Halorientalis brevis]
MRSTPSISRRRFVSLAAAASCGVLAGCAGSDSEQTETTGTTTGTPGPEETADSTRTTTADGSSALLGAIEREAVPFELTDDSENLDAVAETLAETPIVGIGENSHGVREFKAIPGQLVRRLVGDHGYRLLAIEGTLGDFASVNAYVTRGEGDLETAMSSLQFYFWQSDRIEQLFEWLRGFNEGRSESDKVVVRGYDAQHFDRNAAAIRSYLERVDPDYLGTIDDALKPLTKPLYQGSHGDLLTDARASLVEDLRKRLQARKRAYVEQTSESEWQLVERHVETLETGLQFQAALADQNYLRGKEVRDEMMAENVAWLRDWTGSERAVVMGNSNHTMRGYSNPDQQGARMGQYLTERFGDDYYSLGMLFGTGSFTAPKNHDRTKFGTYELGGPVEGTLAATLADASSPRLFLDVASARERSAIASWLDGTSKIQFSVPRAAQKGAVPLPAAPGTVYDGVVFVREVSPASFALAE